MKSSGSDRVREATRGGKDRIGTWGCVPKKIKGKRRPDSKKGKLHKEKGGKSRVLFKGRSDFKAKKPKKKTGESSSGRPDESKREGEIEWGTLGELKRGEYATAERGAS